MSRPLQVVSWMTVSTVLIGTTSASCAERHALRRKYFFDF
jgi:hypothetical protein